MGGPGVYPPQPASVTTEGTYGKFEWKTSEGEDRYRRSLYTFIEAHRALRHVHHLRRPHRRGLPREVATSPTARCKPSRC
jgi:hypothetical protein